MAAVDGLRPAIAEIRAIDHHAHLLVNAETGVALADVLTESCDPMQIEAVREHPAYQRALHELSDALGVDGSEEVFAAARRADFAGYVARLMGECHLDAMFVDDGFRPAGVLSLDEHTALVGCSVRRVVRVEAEAEAASAGWPPFPQCRARYREAIADALAAGAVGLKTIAAYRCGLDLPPPAVDAAAAAYEAWRRSGSGRLRDAALVSLFLADALETAGEGVPLQVHAGVGDADLLLATADPALLQAHIDHGMLAGVPVVLLHCYPYVRQAGYLASIYPNVYLDVSLAVTLLPHRATDLVVEALELAPASKLLFATDASRLPEMYLLGARWWRESLARALGHIVDEGFVDEQRALRWAELILAGNARRVYRFDPRPNHRERRKPPRGLCDAATGDVRSRRTRPDRRASPTTTPLSTTRRPVRLPWLAPRCRSVRVASVSSRRRSGARFGAVHGVGRVEVGGVARFCSEHQCDVR